jgi:hypothetical protein
MDPGFGQILLAFVALGVIGAAAALGAYMAVRDALARWKTPEPEPSRYRLTPTGEPGVHDELGSPQMRRTRWHVEEAHKSVPGFGGRWVIAEEIEEETAQHMIQGSVAARHDTEGDAAWTNRDRLSHWALRYRN